MISKEEIYKNALEQIFRDYKDKHIIMQKIKEISNKTDDRLFMGKEGSKLREVEEYAYSLNIKNKEETVKDEYEIYCTLCSSCGENPCCHYTACVFKAINNNKGCFYPETYKREILIRDYFMEECFKTMDKNINAFLNSCYDVALDKASNYFKK